MMTRLLPSKGYIPRLAVVAVVAVGLLLMWEVSVCSPAGFGQSSLMPASTSCDGRLFSLLSKPSEVWNAFKMGRIDQTNLLNRTINTGSSAGGALLLVVTVATAWYMTAWKHPLVRETGFALVWAFQVVPYVSFAWLFAIAFGDYDKAAFGFTIAIFPMVGALLAGLKTVGTDHREVLLIAGASATQAFQVLYLPKALPFFFSGLYMAAPLTVVGAMLADLSGGDRAGLGLQIFIAARNARPTDLCAFTLAALFVSLLFSASVAMAEAIVAAKYRWYRKEPFLG